ncbi:MAG TPA: hypothetical protein VFZ76_06640, partial [Anaerolineales bacterium]
ATTLIPSNGRTKAKRLGTTRVLEVDTVIFCIGDRVDETFGLPVKWNEFVKNSQPRFPVNGLSYEAYDPEAQQPIEGIFVAGWSREASSGLVGVARKDGENGAQAVIEYLETLSPVEDMGAILREFHKQLKRLDQRIIVTDDLQYLEAAEKAQAEELELEDFKFKSNVEMLRAIDKLAD